MNLLSVIYIILFAFNYCCYSSTVVRTYQNATVYGFVSVDRDASDVCKPVEMDINITFNRYLYEDQSFYIYLSGFTNGPCTFPGNGKDAPISFISNTSAINLYWYEGNYTNLYQDSVLRLYVNDPDGFDPNQEIYIRIDRSNGLKFQCMQDTTFPVEIRKLYSQSYFDVTHFLQFVTFTPQYCFSYMSNLSFYPAQEQEFIELNFTLQLAMDLYAGDNITLKLPGFTHTAFQYYPNGSVVFNEWAREDNNGATYMITDTHGGRSYAARNGYVTWKGIWFENGHYSAPDNIYSRPYNDSYVVFTLARDDDDESNNYIPASTTFSIIVPRSNKLSTYCGQVNNFTGYQFSVVSENSSLSIPFDIVNHSQAIGKGCPFGKNIDGDMRMCSSNGKCNYCNQQCSCFDGYGSESDKAYASVDNFPKDCSGLTCPVGISFAKMSTSSSADGTYAGIHAKSECSDAGICNRKSGTCKCFPGFDGSACQRRVCPGNPVCSGRGKCIDMRRLPIEPLAIPLRSVTDDDHLLYNLEIDGSKWDAYTSQACVCDSSWSVGFGRKQIQLGEYFGPSCEFRRCPSGDDPTTSTDETDCEGKNMVNGTELGQEGNLCYVECSNRGTCDYSTGICTCLPGVYGSNCGKLFTDTDYTTLYSIN